MLRTLLLVATALAVNLHAPEASAQTYPAADREIHPAVRSGQRHRHHRAPGQRTGWPPRWGKPVVIENRPGGDGLVAINAFIAANDDHTLLWVPVGTFAVHPYDKDKLPYDADRDLIPIANVSSLFLALSAPASLERQHVHGVRRSGPRQSRQVQLRPPPTAMPIS